MTELSVMPVTLREPCPSCNCEYGHIHPRNGQQCVYCRECKRFLYNAPKRELGMDPTPVRTGPVSPTKRYAVIIRAHSHCELCGRDVSDAILHIGHIISEDNVRELGLPMHLCDHIDNLFCLCDECNLGMGKRSLPLHDLLIRVLKLHNAGDET
jgi:hypothetical protein